MKTVITFGTFDLFHVGHLRLLERARRLGGRLVVGVSTDALNIVKKGYAPIFGQHDRLAIVAALRAVDAAFLEESLDRKPDYIREHDAAVLVMGNDWTGRFDHLAPLCEIVYLPRTAGVSSSRIRRDIVERNNTRRDE